MQRLQISIYSLRQIIVGVFITILLVLSSNIILHAQFVQQGGKLLGTGTVSGSLQGWSVAVSADGNTAIIGGPSYNGGFPGAAWIYNRTAGVWNSLGEKLIGTGYSGISRQGTSVAISDDGNTALVGAPSDSNGIGAVWVFAQSGGTWTQQGNKLVVGANGGAFGTSVSLSADGNTAIIGAPGYNSNDGAAIVFTRSGGIWTQQGSALTDFHYGKCKQGYSVALSADGNTAIVGCPEYNPAVGGGADGKAFIYTRSEGSWTLKADVVSPDTKSSFGFSVSLSSDGRTAIIGEGNNVNFGYTSCIAWVYPLSSGVPILPGAKKLIGTGNYNYGVIPSAVSLSSDGYTAIVGAPYSEGVFLFRLQPTGSYLQDGSKLFGTGNIGDAYQGYSVALSSDGSTLVFGGPIDNIQEGAAWVFDVSGSPVQQAKFTSTGNIGPASQGTSVAVSADGNTAIVGGRWDDNEKGAAWIFTRSGGIWSQEGQKLVGTGGVFFQQLQGKSVALSADGNTAIVGGSEDDVGKGAAWIFTRSGNTWTQQGSKLVGTGAVSPAQQGYSVSISADGNTAIVGGPYENEISNGIFIGAAWVFTRSGGTWTQQGSKLVGTGTAGAYGVFQGFSVALSADGNTALVGAPSDSNGIGAVWVFAQSGGTWTQQGSKLVGTLHTAESFQGSSVALSADGNTAIVGGYGDHGGNGAVWIFTRSGTTWTLQANQLRGSGGVSPEAQGSSVSLSADGNTAIVGGNSDNSNIGAAWMFTRSGNTWTQQGNKLVGTGYIGSPIQGSSVSISGDGHTAIIGGPGNNFNGEGGAWIFVNTHQYASLKIFLEGPFNTTNTDMNTNIDLSSQLTQPYTSVYDGTESVAAGFFSAHTDIVDWVLVELRTGTDASTKATTRACFLKADGTIVDLDGTSDVDFIGLDPVITEYYVVVHHRNHLPVMSSTPVQLN